MTHSTPQNETKHRARFAVALKAFKDATAELSRAWDDVDGDILGNTYSLPNDFNEVASGIADWTIVNASIVQRATTAEKAQAWDTLMASTASDDEALQDAWQKLREQVARRMADTETQS